MSFWDDLLGDPEGQQEIAAQQLQTQLSAVAMQQASADKEAALKYDPARLAEQRKTFVAIGVLYL